MPPKVKVTEKDVTRSAIELCRQGGSDKINARGIAAYLGCSTQPIFSNFENMESLNDKVRESAYELYLDFLKAEADSEKYPRYKAYGMAYIRFAKEEKELFKLLFMCDRSNKSSPTPPDFSESVEIIMEKNGLDRERAERMHLEMWAFVHGIAVMLATSFLELSWECISDMLTNVYQGTRAYHTKEVKKCTP